MKLWYKVQLKRTIRNEHFLTLSPEAKLTYKMLEDLAASCDAGGYLVQDGVPLDCEQLVAFTGLPLRRQRLALNELALRPGFIERRGDGVICVVGWHEDQLGREGIKKQRQRGGDSRFTDGDSPGYSPHQNGSKNGDSPGYCTGDSPHQEDQDPSGLVDKSTRPSGTAPEKSGTAHWVQRLKDEMRLMLDAELGKLGFEQRVTLGKYAAYRWANCTHDERLNAKKAQNFASQLEAIGSKMRFSTLTVRDFVAAGNRVFQGFNHYPIHSLWAIAAGVEWES